MMTEMNSLKEIADLFLQYDQFVITGHVDPDGDCLGSMLALAVILKKCGKKVRLLLERPLKDNLAVLETEWNFVYERDFMFTTEDQILVILDSGDLGRVPKIPTEKRPLVNIDHHQSNSLFGAYNYVDTEAAAVGEIIYFLCQELGVVVDRQIGYYLAIALIWDTGCFRYSNTTPRVLRMMADFLEMGIDINRIYREFLGSYQLAKIRLRGLVYSEIQFAFSGQVAWVVIDQEMLKRAGATFDDAAAISNDLRDIKGVEVGVSILERAPGQIQLGFRSNYYVPVNEVAQYFGGGGHQRAAGARFPGQLAGLPEKILEKIDQYLER